MQKKLISSLLALSVAMAPVSGQIPTSVYASVESAVDAVNAAATTEEMKTALENPELGLNLTDYSAMSLSLRVHVAGALLAARGAGFADQASIQASLDQAVQEILVLRDVNGAQNANEMIAALETPALGLTLGHFSSWKKADKEEVAITLIGGNYPDLATLQSNFDALIAIRTPVATVNLATTVLEMQQALEDLATSFLGLTMGPYLSWTVADKASVASEVLQNCPADGYTDFVAVQSSFNVAIASRTPMANVNMAADGTAIQTALEDVSLGLDLTDYNSLVANDKSEIANLLLSSRPVTGFVDLATLQTLLDNAIASISLLVDVNAAADPTAMKAALMAPALGLHFGTLYPTWLQVDQTSVAVAVLATRPGSGYSTVSELQNEVDAAIASQTPVATVNTAVDVASMKSALLDNSLGLSLGAYAGWGTADQLAVIAKMLEYRGLAGYSDQLEIQMFFLSIVNDRTPIANVNTAASAVAMQVALEEAALQLLLREYPTFSNADKAAVASLVVAARPLGGFADVNAVQTAFDNALTEVAFMVAVNAAADATAIKAALEAPGLGLHFGTLYPTWLQVDQTSVAAAVLATRPGSGYSTVSELQSALDTAISGRIPIAAVNSAIDVASMKSALENNFLALTFGAYATWGPVDKLAVAADVLAARTLQGYLDQQAIQSAFDAAIAVRTPMANVNSAASAVAMKSALEDATLGLTLNDYSSFSSADKSRVASLVVAARPGSGFVDVNAVQTAFDMALVSVRPMAAVNLAADAIAMEVALEAPVLGLHFGLLYQTWLQADQTSVATLILAARPASGYPSVTELQNALNTIINGQTPVANVNRAVNAASMKSSLEANALALTLGGYAGWKSTDQLAVVADVLAARPLQGYLNKGTIQSAFNAAVAARTPLANVNIAGDAQALRTALENVGLGLNLTEFNSLGENDKLAVATGLVTSRPIDGYVDVASLQNILDSLLVTPAPLEADIKIENKSYPYQDKVTVSGLQQGDHVTVYAADGTTVLAVGTVQAGNTSAVLTIGQLGAASGMIKVTVTRPGYTESNLVVKSYVAENAKTYTISNGSLDRTTTVKATVTVTPGDIEPTGDKFVVFQLMNGTTPVKIVVKQSSVHSSELLTVDFDVPNNPAYTVRVFVVDEYSNLATGVGKNLASPVTIN